MKLFILFALALLPATEPTWFTDINAARTEAVRTDKLILVSFSGLDWCSHCNRMKREIWDSPNFQAMASEKLILVRADFPHSEEHKREQAEALVKQNQDLSKMYNPKGVLPLTVLVDPDGKVLRSWEGYPQMSPDRFTADISTTVDANMQ